MKLKNLLLVFCLLPLLYGCPAPGSLEQQKKQIVKNELPIYEIVSGAALAFAALLKILPGFLTDIIGLLIIFPWTRRLFFKNISKKKQHNKKNFIEGEYEDIDEQK